MDYAQAKTMLASARSKEAGKPIANNTRLFEVEGGIAVRLHNTDILTFAPDGRVTYNSGGWRTNTTKDRMNTFGPARIGAADGLWWVHYAGATEPPSTGAARKDGRILAAGDAGTARDEIALRKSVLEVRRRLPGGAAGWEGWSARRRLLPLLPDGAQPERAARWRSHPLAHGRPLLRPDTGVERAPHLRCLAVRSEHPPRHAERQENACREHRRAAPRTSANSSAGTSSVNWAFRRNTPQRSSTGEPP